MEEKYQDLEISDRTISCELSNLDHIAALPRNVPLLTQQAKINRLSCARDHARYNWQKVAFSDETTIQMSRNTAPAWSREKNPPNLLQNTPLNPCLGRYQFQGKVGIYIPTENLDRHLYRKKILNERLYDDAGGCISRWSLGLSVR